MPCDVVRENTKTVTGMLLDHWDTHTHPSCICMAKKLHRSPLALHHSSCLKWRCLPTSTLWEEIAGLSGETQWNTEVRFLPLFTHKNPSKEHFYSFFYRFGLKFNTLNAVFSFPNQSHQKRNLCKNNWEIRPRVIFSEFLSIPTEQHKLWTHSSKSRNKTKHFLWPFYLKFCKNKTLKLTLGYTLLLDTPESEKIWLESFLVPSNAS